jgi:phage host-nuclease inhibitor protein Gam
MKNRIKLTAPTIRTREQLEALVGEIAALKNNELQLKSAMDAEIQAVRERYESDLAALTKDLDQKMESARAWAEANPAEFADRKSLDLVHAIIGWRTGMPQLKTLPGWTWDRVLCALRDGMTQFVRTKQEVDKQSILANADTLGTDTLRLYGLRVIQDESFFLEPNLTPSEQRLVTQP